MRGAAKERFSRQTQHESSVFSPNLRDTHNCRAGRPAAKEVGMGNPAEGNDRTPNRNHSYEIRSSYVKDFADTPMTTVLDAGPRVLTISSIETDLCVE